MPRRPFTFAPGEYYHIYNRGVEGRDLIMDVYDADRFVQGIDLFNSVSPVGSLYAYSFTHAHVLSGPTAKSSERLVDIIDYCINPNHFHILLREIHEGGVSEIMKRLGGGYSSYFNAKHGRFGTLYQSAFQAKHIDTHEYLMWVHAYVAKNDQVHQLSGPTAKLIRSSWHEYENHAQPGICSTGTILDQFATRESHIQFVNSALELMIQKKDHMQVMARLSVE